MNIIWFNCASSAHTVVSWLPSSSYLWYQCCWATLLSSPRSDRSIYQELCLSGSVCKHRPKKRELRLSFHLWQDILILWPPPPALLRFLSATSSPNYWTRFFSLSPSRHTKWPDKGLRCEEKGNDNREKLRSDPPVKDERGEWGRGKPEDWPLPIRLFLLLVLQLKNQMKRWRLCLSYPPQSCPLFYIVCYIRKKKYTVLSWQ